MKRLVRKFDVTASIGMYDLKNLPKVVEQYGGYDIRHDDKRYSIWKEREFYGDAMNLDDAELIVDCLNDDTKVTSSRRVGRTGRIVASRYVKANGSHYRYGRKTENTNWRGCPEIEMEYYNHWADPSLIYKGYRFNYYDIESALWDSFLEITGHNDSESGNPEVEAEFNEYVCSEGPAYLDDCIMSGYFEGESKDWRDNYS